MAAVEPAECVCACVNSRARIALASADGCLLADRHMQGGLRGGTTRPVAPQRAATMAHAPARMRSILANSHSLLHSGHALRALSQRWMQSRWNTWPHTPQAMLSPGWSGSPAAAAQQGTQRRACVRRADTWPHHVPQHPTRTCWVGLVLDAGLVEVVAADGARVCADGPAPHRDRVPLFDLKALAALIGLARLAAGARHGAALLLHLRLHLHVRHGVAARGASWGGCVEGRAGRHLPACTWWWGCGDARACVWSACSSQRCCDVGRMPSAAGGGKWPQAQARSRLQRAAHMPLNSSLHACVRARQPCTHGGTQRSRHAQLSGPRGHAPTCLASTAPGRPMGARPTQGCQAAQL
jgi:hypothetical protein